MESEARTRKLRIDNRLKDAGWTIVPFHADLDMGAPQDPHLRCQ